MNDSESNKDPRKVSDILFSLEEKIVLLIKTIAANDMNNKLILDRLNKLLNQGGTPSATTDSKTVPVPAAESVRVVPSPATLEVNLEPIKTRKQVVAAKPVVEKKEQKTDIKENSGGKIPVGQRITDSNGKDLFMADIKISNLETGEVSKLKTNAVGKWQAYLGVGKYTVHVSKTIDPDGLHKIEAMQEIEVTPSMKALQLPIIIIKR